jgi:hypothetical protein
MSDALTLNALYETLWARYKTRVPYAARYQGLIEIRGGKVQNDHIAFRTFNCNVGGQPPGVDAMGRIFTALGYRQKDRYVFTDKKLTAWHWEHKTDPKNPKIFISQLEVDQLPPETVQLITKAVAGAPDLVSAVDSDMLKLIAQGKRMDRHSSDDLAHRLAGFFVRPWQPPLRSTVEKVNAVSQYAAWTLLHGNSVNHFTAYINEQGAKGLNDIVETAEALRAAGVPMKPDFEGEYGSKLRQTSTVAILEDCDVAEADGSKGKLNWSYAYYELAERGEVQGPNGEYSRFQAFLGEQATNLFEMTKR